MVIKPDEYKKYLIQQITPKLDDWLRKTHGIDLGSSTIGFRMHRRLLEEFSFNDLITLCRNENINISYKINKNIWDNIW